LLGRFIYCKYIFIHIYTICCFCTALHIAFECWRQYTVVLKLYSQNAEIAVLKHLLLERIFIDLERVLNV